MMRLEGKGVLQREAALVEGPAHDHGRRASLAQILADRHITVSVRKSRGRDIRAACGQLIVEGGTKRSAAQQMALLMGR